MPIDHASLPTIVPLAVAWAEQRATEIATLGKPLNKRGLEIARRVGVVQAENIRVLAVSNLPLPDNETLRQVALESGLLGAGVIGMALGYGIYLCDGHVDERLLSHECRHVWQYEQAGSIAAFLPTYLGQIVQFGYWDAPYEMDARAHEIGA